MQMDRHNFQVPDEKPTESKLGMDQLQVIHIPREVRTKLTEIRRERDRRSAQTETAESVMIATAVVAFLYLAGVLLAYITGLGNTLLLSLPLTLRPTVMILAGAGVVVSAIWVIYTLVQVYEGADEYRERRA
jgi:hypothetical protein